MLTKQKILEILSHRIEEINSLNIPHFSLLSDIKKATNRIIKAINNKEKIVVVGDYDVDGVSSSAIMKLFFEKIGYNIEVVIPDRFKEGYGLTPKLLEKIDANLIITVDNGITSFEAVEICNDLGIDVIVTDHHTPLINEEWKMESGDFNSKFSTLNSKFILPNAYAIVNPKISPDFPFKEICGAEVAWYLCASIKNALNLKIDLREFLDILAIAIIADVMPLTHMNRTLVNMGLKKLNKATKPFSRAIKRFFNKEINSEDIAYQIAPRINAAGRVANAKVAFEFLTSKDEEEAFRLFLELDNLNNLRKEIEKEILDDIEIDEENNFVVVSGDYHEGVIGIIASRIVHKYKKPAIVFSKKDELLKGSGRSLGNIDIFSLVNECKDILEGFGGHKMACGLAIKEENFEKFKIKVNEKIKKYNEEDFFIEDFVLGELPFSEIDFELLDILKKFEPYGEANPKPKFIASAKIEHIQNLKDNHYKLILSQNEKILPAIIFRFDGEFKDEITFKFSISENNYYGREIQLIIEEIVSV
ncbi:single-stranded-DNA-specific exonuclease RecJ [Caminibacter mediatlanticus]|uniref:Single-stranded-DNA-specific exonuclease RecJ n=1 Tax=Caminibacter mediatlanticus TB-2 TaxID=391592 RepID=A0AAI9AG29_9BACT|nr:DHH family phosphoesterase [Caminibacter mediatlanticus]EDM22960.1 RecJ exonuclease [Caminibacter mediatlanticus TB-2]